MWVALVDAKFVNGFRQVFLISEDINEAALFESLDEIKEIKQGHPYENADWYGIDLDGVEGMEDV